MSPQVPLEIDTPIATVRLDRICRRDVLERETWRELAVAFEGLSERDDVDCIVVRDLGAGSFPMRGDAAALALGYGDSPPKIRPWQEIIAACRAIRACRTPTVAIVEGLCVGDGLELAACCDLRVCGESGRFGHPLERVGTLAARGVADPLPELLSPGGVLDAIRSGRSPLGAERARAIGLVSRVHPDAVVVERGYGLAARIAAGAPLVNRWHKRVVQRLLGATNGPATEWESTPQLPSAEGHEGAGGAPGGSDSGFPIN